MKNMKRVFTFVVGVLAVLMVAAGPMLALPSCTPAAQQEARTIANEVLDASQIACVFASAFTDEQAVLEFCKIDSKLAPVVKALIAEREGAKKAGVFWPGDGPKDGGKG